MHIARTVLVAAPAHAVWERVGDPTHWPRDLGRMRCSHVGGSPGCGVGARYWLHLEVGAAVAGSLMEIVEYEPECALSWTTIRGFEQRGHWRLRDGGDGRTELTLGVSYQASGGLAALLTDELASVFVARYLREALDTLARRVQATTGAPSAAPSTPPLRAGVSALGAAAQATGMLVRRGLAMPARPDRLVRSLRAVARSPATTAGRYDLAAALHPDCAAMLSAAGTLTFAQLQRRTSRLAGALAANDIGVGSRVAIMCRNGPGLLEVVLATLRLGADRLLLDPELPKSRLEDLLDRERPDALVYGIEYARRFSGTAKRARLQLIAGAEPGRSYKRPTLEELIASADPSVHIAPAAHEGYTITWPAREGTVQQRARHPPPATGVLAALLHAIPLRARERVLISTPLWRGWGLTHLAIAAALASTLVVEARMDPESALASIARERVSCWVADPAMLQAVMKLPRKARGSHDTSSLRTVIAGGDPLPCSLTGRFLDAYGEILYGVYATDAAGWLAIAGPKDLRRAPGTAGRPLRDTTVSVLDEDGALALPGQSGRVFASNRTLRDHPPDAEAEMFDGLIYCGATGRFDDHERLFIERARKDELAAAARGRR